MYVCGYPTVPAKKYRPRTFFRENLQKSKNFNVSLGATVSCIYLLKSQRFAFFVKFNAMEMV